MSTIDQTIWDRYRLTLPKTTRALYFDVHLGDGADPGAETDPAMLKLWLEATQKRADVVADLGSHWLLIELRDNAMASALGRLGLYAALWKQDPPDSRPLFLALITNREDRDVRTLAQAHGITYEVV